jgi:protein kinase C substrate 80K-H
VYAAKLRDQADMTVAKFFKNPETFTCISHPSIVLRAGQVNDDYCDCPDGSDEPGTSACTRLSPLSPRQPLPGAVSGSTNATSALPGFYCRNRGHRPEYVPSSHVNDGVCDYERCCDGSDEWAHVGGVACEDRCAAMGRAWRAREAEREAAAAAARKLRQTLVRQAAKLRRAAEERLASLESEVVSLKVREEEARRAYEDVERRDRGKMVAGGEQRGRVAVLAGRARARVEALRGALLGMVERRDRAEARTKELEAILKSFKEEYNPNFNDEGVKRAVKAWEDYAAAAAAAAAAGTTDTVFEQDLAAIAAEDDEEHGINWRDWEESDVDTRECSGCRDAG